MEDLFKRKQSILTSRDDFRHDRGIEDKLNKLVRRGSLHCGQKILKVWKLHCLSTPELEQKIPLIIQCRAVDDEVLNVANDVLVLDKRFKGLLGWWMGKEKEWRGQSIFVTELANQHEPGGRIIRLCVEFVTSDPIQDILRQATNHSK